ncbi:MAG: AAA family ATPase [Thermoleophilia bacterium]|nr:AAA family ATPase [Thermoleophilia bacterium]
MTIGDSITVLVALDTGVDRNTLQEALPAGSGLHVVGIVDGLDEGWAVLQQTAADLLVVACAGYSERALALVAASAKQQPERPVVVLCHGPGPGLLARAFQAGADDIVFLPQAPDEIELALQKAVARRVAPTGHGSLAPMICVLGPKGGTGKTLTAANLAVALAERDSRVVLVDLDLQFGDVGLALGMSPEHTIAELARTGGAIDEEKVDRYLVTHASGARVLLAPTRPDHATHVTVDFLKQLYPVLRASNDYVVVDTPPGFTPEVIATIDNASHVCAVATLDSLSLKNTKLGLETLDLMGFPNDRVALVLNRADSRVGLEHDDVVAILGREPDVLVPSDREISRSVNEATPIVLAQARSDAARAFRALSERFLVPHPERNGHADAVTAKRAGLFGLARRG